MGFLDHLFKPKPDEEKMGEGEGGKGEAATTGGNGGSPVAGPDPGAFLQPKTFVPRGGGRIRPASRPVAVAERHPPVEERRQEIIITLGDVLSRIPTQLLQAGLHDAGRELRLSIDDLSADIARGRAAVPLSKIAALCPDLFSRQIAPADDLEIRLPLQKLVEQIGLLRGRPAMPPVEPVARPLPAPPAPEVAPAQEAPPPAAAAPALGDEEIQLSLTAILPGCPPEIIVGQLPPIAGSVRITLPYAPIERQFANERVEVSARRFVSVLPPELQPHFAPLDGVKVALPIEEILRNAPGPPESAPVAVGAPADAASLEAAAAPAVLAEFPAPSEAQPPPPSAAPTIHVHPPPVVRPVLVQPPPILTPSAPAAAGHAFTPQASSEPVEADRAPAAPGLAALSRELAALPGIQACAVERRGETAFAGALPEGFDLAALHAAAAQCTAAARTLGSLQECTLHGDRAALSLFTRPDALLAVFHGTLPPGVRERLAAAAAELFLP